MGSRVDSRVAKATNALPHELRRPVEHWFARLADERDVSALSDELVDQLTRLVACSEFGANVVLRDWAWFVGNVAFFASDTMPDGTTGDLPTEECKDEDVFKSRLRQVRNRTMLRVLWREVFRHADLDETLQCLSDLADSVLLVATRFATKMLETRYGHVRSDTGAVVPLTILAMGKLGGRELNFSSDIDLIFLYAEDGETDGARTLSAQEYFGRLVRQVIALVDETTADGIVFRIDTRLRPFGKSGPPVVSFSALESYLLQHGRDWERYAYVKARVIGEQSDAGVRETLYNDVIRPFVYRRYLDYGVFESLREMHASIAAEVARRELVDNVKTGPGGIREAEFIVQSFQLVRGGSELALQGRGLQAVLPNLVSSRGLSARDAEDLRSAYRFLRRLENFIQAIRDQQTHDLPGDTADQMRLCVAMAYADWSSLLSDLSMHRAKISELFESVAFRDPSEGTPLRERLVLAWEGAVDAAEWQNLLMHENEQHAADLAVQIAAFASSAAVQQVDAVAAQRLTRLMPDLILETLAGSKPLAALTRTLSVVERILRRSAYLALLNENRAAMTKLVSLCSRSQYIADQIAQNPVLLDELLDSRVDSSTVTKGELSEELRERLAVESMSDSEAQVNSIARFQRTTKFRIAVADFHGRLPIMKVSDGLTWLAETVLDAALEVAWRDLTSRHGAPCYVVDGVRYEAGFGIIAYGKLGGLELSYGSDLDIVFLHDSQGDSRETDGEKALDNTMFFARLVRRLVHYLTIQTGSGELYEIDTRLRPDGRSGLLVTSTEAFERYQEENAWTWEHQALLRARPVAGSKAVASEFDRIRKDTLVNRVKRESLRGDVIAMRRRMRKELDRSDAEHFDLKTGAGGIGDIEFLVQYLVLNEAKAHPDVIFYSDNIRQLDALAEAGCIAASVSATLKDCYRKYRLRQHHLILDDRPALVDAAAFKEERQVVTTIWDEWLG